MEDRRDRELGHQLRKHARGVSTAKCSYLCLRYMVEKGEIEVVQDVRKFVDRTRKRAMCSWRKYFQENILIFIKKEDQPF